VTPDVFLSEFVTEGLALALENKKPITLIHDIGSGSVVEDEVAKTVV
jgi:hypothetical protein